MPCNMGRHRTLSKLGPVRNLFQYASVKKNEDNKWAASPCFPWKTRSHPYCLDFTATNLLLSMLLQKTLHVSEPVAECNARLASIQSYRRQFLMATSATVTSSKTVDFSFRGPLGLKAHTVLLSVESDSPDQYAFESVGGNINLMGIVEFAEIRPSCTEVTLA